MDQSAPRSTCRAKHCRACSLVGGSEPTALRRARRRSHAHTHTLPYPFPVRPSPAARPQAPAPARQRPVSPRKVQVVLGYRKSVLEMSSQKGLGNNVSARARREMGAKKK